MVESSTPTGDDTRTAHSPLPWTVGMTPTNEGQIAIMCDTVDDGRARIALVDDWAPALGRHKNYWPWEVGQANVNLIVLAVNHHARLVAALREHEALLLAILDFETLEELNAVAIARLRGQTRALLAEIEGER